jgi:SAM-dependent methyltransferase
LPFLDQQFDLVIANHVLEHIPDDRKAMRELFRVLKNGGRAILQVPYSTTITSSIEDPAVTDPAERSKVFGQHDHVRIYALGDYVTRLSDTGFVVDVMSSRDLAIYHKHALQLDEVFFRIEKPR